MTKTTARTILAAQAANVALQAVINEWDTRSEAEAYVPLQDRALDALVGALRNADSYADTDGLTGFPDEREARAAAIRTLRLAGGHLAWYKAVQSAIEQLSAGTVQTIGYSRTSKAEWAREGSRLDYARAEHLAWEIHATDAAVVAEAEGDALVAALAADAGAPGRLLTRAGHHLQATADDRATQAALAVLREADDRLLAAREAEAQAAQEAAPARGVHTYAVRLLDTTVSPVEVHAVFHLTDLAQATQKARDAAEDGITAQVFDVTTQPARLVFSAGI